jgi:hypothetical protein
MRTAINVKELDIFRNLDTITQLYRRKTNGKESKGSAMGNEGQWL